MDEMLQPHTKSSEHAKEEKPHPYENMLEELWEEAVKSSIVDGYMEVSLSTMQADSYTWLKEKNFQTYVKKELEGYKKTDDIYEIPYLLHSFQIKGKRYPFRTKSTEREKLNALLECLYTNYLEQQKE